MKSVMVKIMSNPKLRQTQDHLLAGDSMFVLKKKLGLRSGHHYEYHWGCSCSHVLKDVWFQTIGDDFATKLIDNYFVNVSAPRSSSTSNQSILLIFRCVLCLKYLKHVNASVHFLHHGNKKSSNKGPLFSDPHLAKCSFWFAMVFLPRRHDSGSVANEGMRHMQRGPENGWKTITFWMFWGVRTTQILRGSRKGSLVQRK